MGTKWKGEYNSVKQTYACKHTHTSIHPCISQGKQKEVAALYQAAISAVSSEILLGPQRGWGRRSVERVY